MGAETIPEETASPPAAGRPALQLVAAPLTDWSPALLQGLRRAFAAEVTDLADVDPGSTTVLLGYGDPAAGLVGTLAREGAPDIPTLLADWQRVCGRMLELRRQWPERVLLIDPSRLDGAAEAALRRRLDPRTRENEGEPESSPAPSPGSAAVALPAVVAHYLGQRTDLHQLFADLEGNAELLGREPELRASPPAARGLVLAERLLGEWLAEGRRLRHEAETWQARAEAQGRELGEQLEQVRREAEEERARWRDSEEERELIQLQLQQVQEELIHTFGQFSQAREQLGEAEQRLHTLERECRTLFLNSQLSARLEPATIPTILQLMRDSLQV
jgi:hypothetical protein